MSTNRPIRLLLVDDHTLFRRGLKALLSLDGRLEVAGEAGDLGEALRCLPQVNPDLVLLDNHLPGVRGVDGIGALKDALPGVRVLMLTVSENAEDWPPPCRAGPTGTCSRQWSPSSWPTRSRKCLRATRSSAPRC